MRRESGTLVPNQERRRWLRAGAAAVALAVRPLHAADNALPAGAALPAIPALTQYLAGRVPQLSRVRLALPPLADNGFAVPARITVAGPFAPDAFVRALRLFAETNPVPDMAVFELPLPLARVEIDTRVRLAGTQHVVAVAEMSDGTLYANAVEVVVTLAGCMDGT